MLLGKRPRPPMQRTTSLTEFAVDLGPLPDPGSQKAALPEGGTVDRRLPAVSSPRNNRRSSTDFFETAHFLRACGLCKRRLGPGRDIYMYRGDTAFCSLECRQQQMNHDERKEKCSLASVKTEDRLQSAGSESSNNGETLEAAA